MATGWTTERKVKQREAIYRWRPWEKSTGPKTAAGKAAIKHNAWKHGGRSAAFRAKQAVILALLRDGFAGRHLK